MLVDGVEGDLDRVNPNDIESISVIKDASAAAIYGGRASFGVILVTTKSGSSDGKVQISYSGRVGWTEPTTSTDYENRGYYHVSLVDQFYIPNNGRRYTSYTEEDMKELWERRNDKTEDPARPWTYWIRETDRMYTYTTPIRIGGNTCSKTRNHCKATIFPYPEEQTN